jgi:D-alanine-D-alanine ligase
VAKWLAEAGYDVRKYDPEVPGKVHGADVVLAPPQIGVSAPLPMANGKLHTGTVTALLAVLDDFQPDVVFPILHSGYGEDGTLQALLDWVGVPYTGSGMLASAMAMNKEVTCTRLRAAGVPVPQGFVVRHADLGRTKAAAERIAAELRYPVIVKPLRGGSTVGLSKVYAEGELAAALEAVGQQGDDALIEALFVGRETTVTIVEGEAYPVIEIRPKEGFYDYTNKYTSGRTEYLCPAPLPGEVAARLQRAAETAFAALGCAGFARVDFLVAENGDFVCLELNTLPGMTANSLVPKAARARGVEPVALMTRLVDAARQARMRTV